MTYRALLSEEEKNINGVAVGHGDRYLVLLQTGEGWGTRVKVMMLN